MTRLFAPLSTMVAAVLWNALLQAQPARQVEERSIEFGTQWTLHSAVLGEDRSIEVHLPPDYNSDNQRYPVLFVLDGEGLFLPAVGVASTLPWAVRSPEFIVVGIPNTQRARDFTTPWTSPNEPSPFQQRYLKKAGGADRFLFFLRTELLPEIDRRYRTTSYRILAGHSLSGFFALYAFAQAPGTFDATLALSPALSWNGDEAITLMDRSFRSAKSRSDSLFLSRAEKEFDDTPRAFEKASELMRLRAPAELQWRTRVVADGDHGTAMLPALQAGLEWAFINWRLPSLIFDEGMDSVERYYTGLSKQYGWIVLPPERELMALGSRERAKGAENSVRFYRKFAAIYPRSLSAQAGLAEALQYKGDLAEAVSA